MLNKLKELRENHEDGFTLIELLVVILIIGILASIAIPVFLNQRKTANDGAVESDVKNAATQVESWIVDQKGGNPDIDAAALKIIQPATKVSSGVSISIIGSANNYCIIGSHANGKSFNAAAPALVAASNVLTYDSATGGLNKDCTAKSKAGVASVAGTDWNIFKNGAIVVIP